MTLCGIHRESEVFTAGGNHHVGELGGQRSIGDRNIAGDLLEVHRFLKSSISAFKFGLLEVSTAQTVKHGFLFSCKHTVSHGHQRQDAKDGS